MKEYKLKRGFKPESERIYSVLDECFPSEITRDGDKFVTSYGVFSNLTVRIEGKKLAVDTVSDRSVTDDEIILDTNKRFRDFLLKATGYTAKERLKASKKETSK
ncbi:MAG TPA: hypothetical protein C5S50_04585 [Methanosarcinaceae archaeon]|nr:hypothetical protein [Methanosarcinaceae archaeon]